MKALAEAGEMSGASPGLAVWNRLEGQGEMKGVWKGTARGQARVRV